MGMTLWSVSDEDGKLSICWFTKTEISYLCIFSVLPILKALPVFIVNEIYRVLYFANVQIIPGGCENTKLSSDKCNSSAGDEETQQSTFYSNEKHRGYCEILSKVCICSCNCGKKYMTASFISINIEMKTWFS